MTKAPDKLKDLEDVNCEWGVNERRVFHGKAKDLSLSTILKLKVFFFRQRKCRKFPSFTLSFLQHSFFFSKQSKII
jgi:hypothetical protein